MRRRADRRLASRADDYAGFRAPHGRLGAPRSTTSAACILPRSTVDTETGLVRVDRVVAAHDCGRPINPAQLESQVHGGVLQGLGYALLEQRVIDRQTGPSSTPTSKHYKLPGAFEVPKIDVLLIENYQGFSATDAYGIAEPATIPTRRRSPTPYTTRSACGCAPADEPRRDPRPPLAGRTLMSMPRFEWLTARSVTEAARAASTTAAAAMVVDARASDAAPSVDLLKAGGVDLIDLMKRWSPCAAPPRQFARRSESRGHRSTDGHGGLRIGALATLEQVAAHPGIVRQRYAALADAAAGSASPQIRAHRHPRRQYVLQRPRCWYFLVHPPALPAAGGGGRCFAIHGETLNHAVFANEVCAVVHPSTPRYLR